MPKSKVITTSKGKATIFYDPAITPKDKKYAVRTPEGKLIHFGARNYSQFKDQALGLYKSLDHNDKARRDRYRQRHKTDNYKDPEYPGYYSWFYLW